MTNQSYVNRKLLLHYAGAFSINLYKLNGKDRYMVEYGKQTTIGTSIEAAHNLGECIMHSLSCQGKTDDFDIKS